MLAAGDTFRAALSEQLTIWADRVGVPIVKHQEGADAPPSSSMPRRRPAKGMDILVDTAGRLQTKSNLMEELRGIGPCRQPQHRRSPQETLLVLDATTGRRMPSSR